MVILTMSHHSITDEYLLKTNLSDDYKEILEDLEDKSKTLCTQLQERLITLTASVKTLKKNVTNEKELWRAELKETIELEKKFSEHQWQSCLPSGDYNHQLDMLTNAVLKSHAIKSAQIQRDIDMSIYKQKIMEAENMCNLEMLKVKNSLECLAPLKAIVDDWNLNEPETDAVTCSVKENSETLTEEKVEVDEQEDFSKLVIVN